VSEGNEQVFSRLAPWIREYIYRYKWESLRPVQVAACHGVLDTSGHVLLASATASGKTEAAFFPVLTQLWERPSTSVGVLYIGPLKALINDQFQRLDLLLQDSHIPVSAWHGDTSPASKQRLLKSPQGILQITPESLEGLLINRSPLLRQLFGDLRFVIIDEVHAFMGTDRGGQVLCQLQRLARIAGVLPRRIGLSATLGDYRAAEQWLAADTGLPVFTPKVGAEQRVVRIAMEQFYEVEADAETVARDEKGAGDKAAGMASWGRYVYEASCDRKVLIFANRRDDVEKVVADLRQWSEMDGRADVIFAHHGNVSAALREAAEQAMRQPNQPAVVAATVTLELGVDIGQLDRVIQLDAPSSVSSFVQRLGRSGRSTSPAEMWFVCRDHHPDPHDSFVRRMPWGLLQSIAIVELYRCERFVETRNGADLPYSLLYHQTMSTLLASGELTPSTLAQRVLGLYPFRSVPVEDYRLLLLHLLAIDHIQETESKALIVGLSGEKVARNFRFFAVFADADEFRVVDGTATIGTVPVASQVGERFALAGRSWEVLEVDEKGKTLYVRRVAGRASTSFVGQGAEVHVRIVQGVRDVLTAQADYPYLQHEAREGLHRARQMAHAANLGTQSIVAMGGNQYALFPWISARALRTLARYIRRHGYSQIGVTGVEELPPYVIIVTTNRSATDLAEWLQGVRRDDIVLEELVSATELLHRDKYDSYIPGSLLRKAFVSCQLEEWV